ncbi:MAG: lactonase family protein [Eubacteriales bacterium]
MRQEFLFGGYGGGSGKGISSMVLDTEEKCLGDFKLLSEVSVSSYFAADVKGHIYVGYSENGAGGIASFDLDSMTLINSVTEQGHDCLCHVCVDEDRDLVYGANYVQGIVYAYKRLPDGSLVLSDRVQHNGSGPRVQQDRAHAHYVGLTPDSRLAVCDLGTDSVYVYNVSEDGKLSLVSAYEAEKGSGCRHLVFHPALSAAYVLNELSSTVDVLEYLPKRGKFVRHATVPMLPEGFSGFNGAAAIRISGDGRFLYATNRGHNSIVSYSVSPDGLELTTLSWTSTCGDFPRDIVLSADGRFLLCGNERDGKVVLFERDTLTGELSVLQRNIAVPLCSAVYGL